MIPTNNRLKKVLGALLIVSPFVHGDQLSVSGSLEQTLKAIGYGTAGDEQWVEPTAAQEVSFRAMVSAFLAGDYAQAASFGNDIAYDVIEYTDTDVVPATVHYLLMGQSKINQAGFRGWGLYARNPGGRDLLIQAPHPRTDLYTERQAIELYLASSAGLLSIAGTRRDSTAELSTCSGSYPKSDAAHHTLHPFQYFHEAVNDASVSTAFLELHGFGSGSLNKLKKQCRSGNDKLVNLSEGVNYRPGKKDSSLMLTLEAQIDGDGLAEACVYGRDTKSLGGTTNTHGRYTNGSVDVCTTNAESSEHRWIHLEQSYEVRSAYRAELNQSIIRALDAWSATALQ